jgi:hypothetical protein
VHRARGSVGERRLGRPCLRWAASPTSPLWPPLRLARLCREHESVLVVCPPGLPSCMRAKGEIGAVHRVRRASGLLRDRDLRRGARALRGSCRQQPGGVADPGRQPWPGGSGCVGGDRQRAGHRAAARAACRAGRRGGKERAAGDHRGQGQDRSPRRAHARAAAGRGAAARVLAAG